MKSLQLLIVAFFWLGGTLLAQSPAELLDRSEQSLVSDPEAAARTLDEVREALLEDRTGEWARYRYLQGRLYRLRYDYANAMGAQVAALEIFDDLKDENAAAQARLEIGQIFLEQEEYESALVNLQQARKVFEQKGESKLLAVTDHSIGDVFLAQEFFGKALERYNLVLENRLAAEDVAGAARIAAELGSVSSQLGDHDGALVYHSTRLDLENATGNTLGIAEAFGELTASLLAQGDYEAAAEANAQSRSAYESLPDAALGRARTDYHAARIAAARNNSADAMRSLATAESTLAEMDPTPGGPELLRSVSALYAELGNYDAAYRSRLDFTEARNALINEEKAAALHQLTTRYESQFAAREQARRIELLEVEQSNHQRLVTGLFAVIALIGLLLFSLYANYQRKKRDNRVLSEKNAEIERQRAEIEKRNAELATINSNLDTVNGKLVDEIAEREALEKSSFARDRFLATMSHEMRTPINIIIGLTHLLLDENPRADQIEHLRTLQFSANNLVVFINDVLDFSKIEAGKLSLDSREFNPHHTFSEIKQRFTMLANEEGTDITFDFDRNIPEKLMGDPARLNQIISNLVNTSLHESATQRIELHADLYKLDQRESMIRLVITDDGTGIDPKRLENILRQYSRNPGDVFEGYSSADLGLAITKRLVELQNGKLEIHQEEGEKQGLRFVVILPFKLSEDRARRREIDKTNIDLEQLAGRRVLLAEDNRINQLVVAKMLRKIGMDVTTANDGAEALDRFAAQSFDLVLMDIQMPNVDGYRATAEIRKHPDAAKRDVPIIALTASAFLTEREKARLFGMNEHVGKPFGPEELLEKIGTCLGVEKKARFEN